ncbi:alpha-amylase [Leptothoe sp. PORK10 BA2]|uniref:alpha-amylase n=1 Tax=Leptothoe sp. PORK10 BA2 TaxID=3110254 RepID=UPI002B1F63E4|nr:alpha-amylase family protein [Leptothoe sp. PORK10 BA2]MEA5463069.1 alpha-amylase family protein [Leptothoe sp. PORK10 BA2]
MRPSPLATLARQLAPAVCALGLGGCQVAAQLSPTAGARQMPNTHTVIVQLFEWRWSDVAQECETWLGPHGYGAVQISPPHKHRIIAEDTNPFPWYQRYQPVSYELSSRSGSQVELTDMISRCNRSGVKVYADVVINQLANTGAAQGIASRSQVNATDVAYDHGATPWQQPGLDTGSESVQAEIATAINQLLDLGVAGFHIEAAQHTPPQDLAKIVRQLQPLNPQFHANGGRPFVYQAVADTGSDSVKTSDYLGNGAVTEFDYGRNLGEQVRHGQLKNLMLFGEAWNLMPSHQAVVFTDNHVTQRGRDRNIVTFDTPADDGASYTLANVFMLAWPYGIPKVMSSYNWPREVGNWVGPPATADGQTLPVSCGHDWVCEHRWPNIAHMVEFRNVTQSAPTIDHWWDNGNNQIAFARGTRGFVVINNETTPLTETLMTGLPPGLYCNVLSAETATAPVRPATDDGLTHDCHSSIVVDENGSAKFAVPPRQAAAIHIGQTL